jgi:hypothetical protein
LKKLSASRNGKKGKGISKAEIFLNSRKYIGEEINFASRIELEITLLSMYTYDF